MKILNITPVDISTKKLHNTEMKTVDILCSGLIFNKTVRAYPMDFGPTVSTGAIQYLYYVTEFAELLPNEVCEQINNYFRK